MRMVLFSFLCLQFSAVAIQAAVRSGTKKETLDPRAILECSNIRVLQSGYLILRYEFWAQFRHEGEDWLPLVGESTRPVRWGISRQPMQQTQSRWGQRDAGIVADLRTEKGAIFYTRLAFTGDVEVEAICRVRDIGSKDKANYLIAGIYWGNERFVGADRGIRIAGTRRPKGLGVREGSWSWWPAGRPKDFRPVKEMLLTFKMTYKDGVVSAYSPWKWEYMRPAAEKKLNTKPKRFHVGIAWKNFSFTIKQITIKGTADEKSLKLLKARKKSPKRSKLGL